MDSKNPIIKVVNLTKRFGPIVALEDINFEIEEGKITAILGPSGSGKSVLVKLILGLMRPTKGEIIYKGKNIFSLSEEELYELRKDFSMLLQDGALFDSMTVEENLVFPLKIRKAKKEEVKSKVDFYLKSVGLEGFNRRYPSQLSGGQRRRVALARAFITEPKIIILDEPTTGLDPITTESIENLILSIKEKNKEKTFILITHDPFSAFKLADNIAVLFFGKLIYYGSKGEVVERMNSDKTIFHIFKRANLEIAQTST
jgi:phospholipid/cholesterol/gamma-HCH transport system ATP-binding protein